MRVAMLVALLSMTGCMALGIRTGDGGDGKQPKEGLYWGTRGTVHVLTEDLAVAGGAVTAVFLIVDLPFTLVVDTILIPYDLIAMAVDSDSPDSGDDAPPEPVGPPTR